MTGTAGVRDAVPDPPVRGLTVLHDPGCPLCGHLSDWLSRQPQLVPLEFVPVGSEEARRRFPGVDQTAAFREITVVGDGGQVWTGHHAFVTCLWALAQYRPLAHRLSTPAGLPLARGAALAAAKYRAATWAPGRVEGPYRPPPSPPPQPPPRAAPHAPPRPWSPPSRIATVDAPGCDGDGRCAVPDQGLA